MLKKQVKRLQGDKSKLQTDYKKMCEALKKVFTKKQIEVLLSQKNKTRVHWTLEDISAAISLRSISPRAYRYLKDNNYPLPGLSTLRNWACRMELNPGILESIIFLMKEKSSNLKNQEKLCMICFDEIYISRKIEINKTKEQVVGPHKSVQVGMARGIFSSWKQIIFYAFDKPLDTSIILNSIRKLYEAGYIVVAFTCDLGPTNAKVLRQLNIGIEPDNKCYFQHPSHDSYKVFVFNDAPHLLKLVRNHFIDYGFIIDEQVVSKECVEEAISLNDKDLKVVFKITQESLDVRGSNRQKVSTAAKLFSKTTARGVLWCGQQGFLKAHNFQITCEFLELIDSWFDVFNSKLLTNKFGKEPYGINLQHQNKILNDVTEVMLRMKVGQKKNLLPFQKGFILNNESLKNLFYYLKETFSNEAFNVQFILTNRLTQDVIENLFSYIRSMGIGHNHPSALNFQYRLRWYILGKHSGNLLDKRNTEEDGDNPLINFDETGNTMIKFSLPAIRQKNVDDYEDENIFQKSELDHNFVYNEEDEFDGTANSL